MKMKGLSGAMAFGLVAAMALAGVVPATAGEDVRAAVEAANDRFEEAVSRKDGAGLAALYTPDGQLLPPQSDLVKGTKAIGEFWQGVLDSGIGSATLTTVEVDGHGDTAHEVGRYELRAADGSVLDQGKYVVIWKKDAGNWKLHRDIWNTSMSADRQ